MRGGTKNVEVSAVERTFPAMATADWETRASGPAGWFMPSSEFEPAPPVEVETPSDSEPSGKILTAMTAFSSLLLVVYIALPSFGGELHEPGLADTCGSRAAARDTAKVTLGVCI